ncbi:phage/plasmid primase, P4 family [Terriglobus sp. RCC_193]|uniref:phage/plasmid primase, P4 family n=1 Tax=Terriglobus sp. RCC_193 TaxID=3239218 RepID=UPI0035263A3E
MSFSALEKWNQFIARKGKLPCNYLTGVVANPLDPIAWASHETIRASGHDLGFVLTENDPFWLLDIDSCLVDGAWSPLAQELCRFFSGCYIEVSQSGGGLHIIGSGRPSAHSCRNAVFGMEFYSSGRYVALTGTNSVGDAAYDASALLPALIAKYFPASTAEERHDWTTEASPEWRGPSDDSELIRRASRSQSLGSTFGSKASFSDLWTANAGALEVAYPKPNQNGYDASAADAALAQHLSFWTGGNCERIERLMRQSRLLREKWERKDYLPQTILRAVERTMEVYHKAPLQSLDAVDQVMLQVKTQDSVAEIFARKYEGSLVFDHTRSKWLEWIGTRWQIEQTGKAFDFARLLSRETNRDGKAAMGSESFCSGVEKLARTSRTFAQKSTDFDRDNYTLNTPTGTIDLRTGDIHKHDSSELLTMCTAVAPASGGGSIFHNFLSEITLNDAELIEFLQVALGSCLSGAVESHWMLFWIGAGRNGKNTLGDLVMDVMGDYARKVPTATLMAKRGESHPTDIANLCGVRLAVSSEINDGEHWDEARINEITGDARLSARFMRGDLFEFNRTHKHLIYGNHRPQLRSVGDGVRSRIRIVPFRASFIGRKNANLPRQLRDSMAYVLSWLIDGHRKWLVSGKRLPQCRAVEDESADYFASQSTPDMWLEDRAQRIERDTRAANTLPKASDLYADYSAWKRARGESPVSQQRFSEFLQREFKKERSDGFRYRGLALKASFIVGQPFS